MKTVEEKAKTYDEIIKIGEKNNGKVVSGECPMGVGPDE